jgi:ribosomal protein L11
MRPGQRKLTPSLAALVLLTTPIAMASAIRAAAAQPAVVTEAEDAEWTSCVKTPQRACLLAQALRLAQSAGENQKRADALREIAIAQGKIGLAQEARSTFERVIEVARANTDAARRAGELEFIASAHAESAEATAPAQRSGKRLQTLNP